MANNDKKPQEDSWKSTVRHAVLTDVGMRRAINQDSMGVMLAESQESWDRLGHLFLVADGMGAHAAGERASQLAVDLIPQNYRKNAGQTPAESLHQAIVEANSDIFRRGQANIEFRSMGTTCSVLTLLPEGAVVAHVGDSRVYQLHGDNLYQLTFDHSLVWEMQAAGEVTDETARSGVIPKNVITRSLGPNASVEVDLEGPFPVRLGDRYLLCSDGLSGQVTDEEIGTILEVLNPKDAAQLFIDLSNLRGGPDNITAIVVEVADEKMVTSHQGSITLRRPVTRPSFSPALGVVSAVCILLALVFWFVVPSNPAYAIVTGILGLVALAAGIAQVTLASGNSTPQNTRYGNGPYRQYRANAHQQLFEHLAGTMKSLREAAEERKWVIKWKALDEHFAKACKLADQDKFAEAFSLQSKVIIELMSQIRDQRKLEEKSDSSIDL
ncbi:MAG: PP2C family serine/threonine-protein phosphatase [Planctomycetota bacterium]